MLGLRPSDLDAIHRGNDLDRAFTTIILMWLRQNYDVHKHGPPTWRNLVEAVDDPAGGNNHALAMSIADKHSDTGKQGLSIHVQLIPKLLYALVI